MKPHKTLRAFLVMLLAFSLVFSMVSWSAADDDAYGDIDAFDVDEPEVGVRAAASAFAEAGIEILNVEVLYGGDLQAGYRNALNFDVSNYTVYEGGAGKPSAISTGDGEAAGRYYTTSRSASMTDPRVFTVQITTPAGEYTGVGSDPSEFDVNSIGWKYGGRAFSDSFWRITGLYDYSNNPNGTGFTSNAVSLLGAPFAEMSDDGDSIIVTAKIKFDTFYDNVYDKSAEVPRYGCNRNVPYNPYYSTYYATSKALTYTNDWELEAYYDDALLGSETIRMALYDDFHTWQEIDEYASGIAKAYPNGTTTESSKGRYLKMDTIGKSTDGEEIWTAVVADSKASVDEYLGVTKPLMIDDPAALKAQLSGGSQKSVIYFNSIHATEVIGADISLTLVDRLLNEDTVTYAEREKEGLERVLPKGLLYSDRGYSLVLDGSGSDDIELDINAVLDKFIIVFTFTSNPDGRVAMTRQNAYGVDMNRDASYMSQMETMAIAEAFGKWDPLFMMEYHGYYDTFMIDATTPPHEPSYEFDLMGKYQPALADYFGKAAVGGNTPFYMYTVPKRDVAFRWDDGSTIYTPCLAMLYGAIGSNVEFPFSNQDSVDAGVAGTLGIFRYCLENRDDMYTDKVEGKRRGVENIDSPEVDKVLVNIDPLIEEVRSQLSFRSELEEQITVGRPRKDGQSFYPEYYIIPVDPVNQRNIPAAFEIVKSFVRNSVKVEITTKEISYSGKIYPAGTYIINMYQANRNVAQALLYEGYDASIYPRLYANMVTNYPDMRGFNSIAVFDPGVFSAKTVSVADPEKPAVNFDGNGTYVIVKNNSSDATRFVNRLLAAGKDVYMIDGYVPGTKLGDFVVKRADVAGGIAAAKNKILGDLPLYIDGFDAGNTIPERAKAVVKPKIGYYGYSAGIMQYAMDLLEFSDVRLMTASAPRSDANVFLVYYNAISGNTLNAINRGTPIIYTGLTSSNFNAVLTESENKLGINGMSPGEALLRGSYSNSSSFTSYFDGQETMYLYDSNFMTRIPGFMKPLFITSTEDDFFKAGWWYTANPAASNNKDSLKGGIMAASGTYSKAGVDIPMLVMADNVYYRTQDQISYKIISDAMFAFASGVKDEPRPAVSVNPERTDGVMTQTASFDIRAEDTAAVGAAVAVQKYKVSASPLEPAYGVEGTGWKDIPAGGLVSIFDASSGNGVYYLHWYVENSKGVSSQGTFGPYVKMPASVVPTAFVTKLNGNQNDLTINISETFADGRVNVVTATVKIANNAAGTYTVGDYKVYVDTKGNTQVREIYLQ